MTNSFYKKSILFLIIAAFILSPDLAAARKSNGGIGTCKAAIFSDSTRVKRLYGRRVHKRVLAASTTKVLTALVVFDHLPFNKYVTVSKRATYVQPTKINVRAGERYRVRDLLYAILLNSANDASVVLAEAVAGSESKFVALMNKKARQLGARNTKFANSNGLPTKKNTQYTTAYDMYLIFRAALKNPFFRQTIRLKYKTIYTKAGRKIVLKTHNKILYKNWKNKIYGKTGYTRAAGACFVGTLNKGRSTLIIAVFGCTKRWEYIKYVVSRYGGIPL